MNFLDLFAGIGGFRLGMERAGHKCIGYCEVDKFARMSYQAIHDTKGEIDYKDITEVTNEEFRKLKGTVDVICGGFPCQAFSVAGKQLGFEDVRGTLFYEIVRAAKEIKPRYLFLENVRNLLSHDKGKTFTTMLTILDELGYDAEWQVLNSKNFGVPQNRERVFIIGHLRGECTSRVFPIQGENKESDREPKIKILGNVKNPNCRSKGTRSLVHDKNAIVEALTATDYKEPKKVAINFPKILQIGRGFNKGGVHNIAPTITKNSYQENNFLSIKEATKQGYAIANIGDSINLSHPNSKTRRGRVGKNIANTLLTSDEQGVVLSDYKIRKLTPRECWRLQGFPDWAFDKAQKVNSNSQLYKQAGNSVTVNVIEEIAKKLK